MTRCRFTVKRLISGNVVAIFDVFRDNHVSYAIYSNMIRELLANDLAEHIGFPPEFTKVQKENAPAHVVAICEYLSKNLGYDVQVSYPPDSELPIGGTM